MLSIEIIRKYNNLTIIECCQLAGISKQAYYNALAGTNLSQSTIKKLSKAFNAPYLPLLQKLDIMHQSNFKVLYVALPDSVPKEIQSLIYKEHPVFQNPEFIKSIFQPDIKT